jgi:CHAT domain-containing protein/Tfp pilus assembly protein PilF
MKIIRILIFVFALPFIAFCQSSKDILKEGSLLVYRVKSGINEYDFTLKIMKTAPDLVFNWGMEGGSYGIITIKEVALRNAIRLKNYFTKANETLDSMTSVWVSQKTWSELKKNKKTELIPIKRSETLSLQSIDDYTINYDGKKRNVSVLNGITDKNNNLLILDDKNNPVILKMKINFEIELKEIWSNIDEITKQPGGKIKNAEKFAKICYDMGEYGLALDSYKQLLNEFEKTGLTDSLAGIIIKISRCYDGLKKKNAPFEYLNKQTKTEFINFKITEIIKKSQDTVFAEIEAGSIEGIFKGSKGEVTSIYSPENKERGSKNIGKCEVIYVDKNYSRILIIIPDTTKKESEVLTGDLVNLPVKIPEIDLKNIFYDLISMSIEFTNGSSKKYFTLREIIDINSIALEEGILHLMAADIHETADVLKPMLKDNPKWAEVLSAGKYRGRTMIDIMEKADKNDILAFLDFVKSYPGKYMGGVWRIDETFATWVLNNAPIGREELKNILLNAKDKTELSGLIDMYKNDIPSGDFNSHWNSLAEEMAKAGKFNDAYKLNEISTKAAESLNDNDAIGWAYFNRAQILNEEEKYKESNSCYEKAISYFEKNLKNENNYGIDYSYQNIASNYISLNRYEEALKKYDESLQLKVKRLGLNPAPSLLESISNACYGKGLSLYKMSKFEDALKQYNEAITYCDKANTLKALKLKADLIMKISDSYEKLGRYKEALAENEKALKIYSDMAEKTGEASANNSMGFDYYKLGDYSKSIEFYDKAYRISMEIGNKKEAGFSKSNIGQMYWNLGKYDLAINAHNEAVKLKEEANDKAGQAYSLEKLSGLYNESGDANKALEFYNKSMGIYSDLKDSSGMANSFKNIGNVYKKVKDIARAIDNYKKALNIYKSLHSDYETSELFHSIAGIYYDDKNYKDAFENYNESLKIRKATGDKSGQIYSLSMLGLIALIHNADYTLSEKYFNDAMALANEIGSKSDLAYCYSSLSTLHNNKGDYPGAIEYILKALKLYEETDDKPAQSTALCSLGYIFATTGNFNDAIENFEKSLKIAESSNNRYNIAAAYTGLGEMNYLLGEINKSFDYLLKSLDIFKEVKNDWGIAFNYIALGNAYNNISDYSKALTYYNYADSIYKNIGNELNRATPINNIGTIYFWQGEYEKAMPYFEDALKILNKNNFEGEFLSIIKSNIGEIYYEKKDYPKAESWLKESMEYALKINAKRANVNSSNILSKVYIDTKNYTEAGKTLDNSLNTIKGTGEKDKLAEVNLLLGKLYYEKKEYDKSSFYLNESANISRAAGNSKYLWEALYISGCIYKSNNDLKKSIEYLKEAVNILEDIKNKLVGGEKAKKIFASGEIKLKIYETLISSLIESGDIQGALDILEKSNAEGLKEKFGKLDIKFKDENKNNKIDKEKDLKIKLDGMNEEISKEKSKPEKEQSREKIISLEKNKTIAETGYTKFINETISEFPDLANHFRKSVNPLEFRKVKRQIPDDAAIIAYLAGEEKLYIFAATKDTVIAKVIDINKNNLDMKVDYIYNLIRNPLSTGKLNTRTLQTEDESKKIEYNTQVKPFKKFSEELYNLLIAPVEDQIKNKKNIAIIPNGGLYYLPFQVLGKTQKDETFQFLVKDKSIFYISSLNVFFKQSEGKENPKILAFGNADNSLPNAEIEVKDIQQIYPDAKIYIRDAATKDKVKNLPNTFNTIHFATHGNLDYNDIKNSYLTLAPQPDKQDNGKLTLEEVWQITNLYDCKMVTLSACNTAISKEIIQGWLVNPANAFLDAGVQTVIATLWQVNDKATSILMKEFYENLKTMSKIDALRKAQETLTQNPEFVDPYYWAAFVLVGDWR